MAVLTLLGVLVAAATRAPTDRARRQPEHKSKAPRLSRVTCTACAACPSPHLMLKDALIFTREDAGLKRCDRWDDCAQRLGFVGADRSNLTQLSEVLLHARAVRSGHGSAPCRRQGGGALVFPLVSLEGNRFHSAAPITMRRLPLAARHRSLPTICSAAPSARGLQRAQFTPQLTACRRYVAGQRHRHLLPGRAWRSHARLPLRERQPAVRTWRDLVHRASPPTIPPGLLKLRLHRGAITTLTRQIALLGCRS